MSEATERTPAQIEVWDATKNNHKTIIVMDMDTGEISGPAWDAYQRYDTLLAHARALAAALEPLQDQAKHHVADAPEWTDRDSVTAILRVWELREADEALTAFRQYEETGE